MEEKLLNLIHNYLEYADLYPCNPMVIYNQNDDFQIVSDEINSTSKLSEPLIHLIRKNKSRGIYEPDPEALARITQKLKY